MAVDSHERRCQALQPPRCSPSCWGRTCGSALARLPCGRLPRGCRRVLGDSELDHGACRCANHHSALPIVPLRLESRIWARACIACGFGQSWSGVGRSWGQFDDVQAGWTNRGLSRPIQGLFAQHSTVLYSTVQWGTIQDNNVQRNAFKCNATQRNAVQRISAQRHAVPYGMAQNCVVHLTTAKHGTIQHCTTQHRRSSFDPSWGKLRPIRGGGGGRELGDAATS